ncbi:MAG: transposase [Bdellovibrionales bacterium]|nr:transposase [Bdellovibrionales bacterium]
MKTPEQWQSRYAFSVIGGRLVEIMKVYAVLIRQTFAFYIDLVSKVQDLPSVGFVNSELTLSDREWTCESRHIHHDRDVNAAINIQNEGWVPPVHQPVERRLCCTGRKAQQPWPRRSRNHQDLRWLVRRHPLDAPTYSRQGKSGERFTRAVNAVS